jgi:outer membrane beta-barrel protein
MESWIRVLLLITAVSLSGCSTIRGWLGEEQLPEEQRPLPPLEVPRPERSPDADTLTPPKVIEPEVERREINVAQIDTENFELGAYFGTISIEDFGTNSVYGVSGSYHVTEDFFFKGEIGRSTAGRTSFETISGNISLLDGDDRRFTYYNLALGYNFLPGEVFLGRGTAMTSVFYVIGGIGATEFAGDDEFTVSFGAGYRVLPSDWLAVEIGVMDRVFESDLLGTTKLTNNLEAHIGATVFF